MKRINIHQEPLKLIACVAMLLDHIGAVLVPCMGLRIIGRIAFPIYCFLLVEGCTHTKKPRKYGQRLLTGVLLAELPFDFLFYGTFTWQHQNVMLTLFLGFLMIRWMSKSRSPILPFFVCFLAAELLRVDYGGFGIAVIAAFLLTADVPHKTLRRAGLLAVIFLCMGGYRAAVFGAMIPIQLAGLLAAG